uniref:lysoplasmalogenase n=1 Tax=Ascaris lumbricoides TaxID=6252 RepID=A0A0M3I6G9_ASCLU
MGSYGPAQVLGIYGGIVGLIYIETDGLRHDTPLLYALPPLALAAFTYKLTMNKATKLLTSISFIAIGGALYLLDRRVLPYTISLMTFSHLFYLFSFMKCMRRLWNELAIILTIYFGGIFYYCFGDLFASIPMLVTFLTIHLGIVRVSILTAGSIWFYGSKRSYARQGDLLRFVGLLTCLACSSILLLNRFGRRLQQSHYLIKLLCYLSQPLLFFANERTF